MTSQRSAKQLRHSRVLAAHDHLDGLPLRHSPGGEGRVGDGGWTVGFGESTPLGRWCGGGVVRIKGARKLSPEKLAATQNLGSACSRMHTGLPVLGTLTEPSRHHEFLGHDSFGNRCDQWFHGNTDTQPSMAGPCPPRETACLRTSEVLAQNTVSDGPAQVLSGGNGHWPICQLKISLGGG